MRIDDNGMTTVNATQANRVQAPDSSDQQAERAKPRPGQQIEDRVQLSSLAASVNGLQDDSATREAGLQSLAARFQAGRLEVNAERVADALIDQELNEDGVEL
jgi:flagellar biosynthesis anti-sigma factor FlgM